MSTSIVNTRVAISVSDRGIFRARAGKGNQAMLAYSTSDALTAAYRAAEKYFSLPAQQLVVERVSEEAFFARTFATGEVLTEITFEDKGQDFLYWVLSGNGVVLESRPFQSWIWCGGRVTNLAKLQVGGTVDFESDLSQLTIKYRIENLLKRTVS